MMGSLLKVLGVGALITGTAAALYALNKKQDIKQTGEELGKQAQKAADKVKEQVEGMKKSIKERPARLTGADWYEKGLALLNGAEDDAKCLAKAKECFANASKLGYVEGTRMLAEMYGNGYGVEQDRVKSFELYREAAENGDEESWTQLGTCYAEGVGTEINPIDAFYWFAMAAAAGDETAKEILGDLAEDITEHTEYPLEVVRDWYAARYTDLSEEEQLAVEAFWDNCEDDILELDTDFFADDEAEYIVTDVDEEFCTDCSGCCDTCDACPVADEAEPEEEQPDNSCEEACCNAAEEPCEESAPEKEPCNQIEQAKKDVQDIAEDVAQNLAEAQRDIEAATEDLGRKEE